MMLYSPYVTRETRWDRYIHDHFFAATAWHFIPQLKPVLPSIL